MKRHLHILALLIAALIVVLGPLGTWYVYSKQPVRSGTETACAAQAPTKKTKAASRRNRAAALLIFE